MSVEKMDEGLFLLFFALYSHYLTIIKLYLSSLWNYFFVLFLTIRKLSY